jgi:hypothetical protein
VKEYWIKHTVVFVENHYLFSASITFGSFTEIEKLESVSGQYTDNTLVLKPMTFFWNSSCRYRELRTNENGIMEAVKTTFIWFKQIRITANKKPLAEKCF